MYCLLCLLHPVQYFRRHNLQYTELLAHLALSIGRPRDKD